MINTALEKTIRWVTIGALFLVPLLPLLVANTYFFPFITGKNFVFRILIEIAFVGWLLLMTINAKYRPRFTWPAVLFGAFTIWMAIADAFAVNPAKAFWSNYERMDGWVTLSHVFLFFLVTGSIFAVDKLWKKWWGTWLAISAILCVYGFMQVGGMLAIHQGGVRLDATFGNSDYLACYMLFSIAVSLWIAFESKVKAKTFNWLRYILLLLTLFEVIILFLTATRGAILAFVGAAALGGILWAIESGKKGRRVALGGLLALVLIVGGFFLLRNESFIRHDPTLGRLASISLSDPETHTRLTIWHMAYEGFLQRPVTGWGQDGFNYVFNKYYEPVLQGQEPWFDRAHNTYLDWLIAGGFPALLLFLALLASLAYTLLVAELSRTERVLLISAVAAYCAQAIFVFDNLFSYVPLTAIIAMAHATVPQKKELFPKLSASIQKISVLGTGDFVTYSLPIGVVALVVLVWIVNIPSMTAAGDLIIAITPTTTPATTNIDAFKKAYADNSFADQEITEQLITFTEGIITNQQISTPDKQAVYTYALQQAKALVTAIPQDARIRLEYALLYRAGGNYAQALEQIHIAEQLSPKKQSILIEEGVESLQSGNLPAANAAFAKAYTLDTSFPDIAVYAAAGDILTGKADEGKALLQKLYGTTAVDQDIVLLAYYQTKDYPNFIATWQKRVADKNNSAEAMFGLAAAYANAGQVTDARAEIQEIIKQHPDQATQAGQFLQQLAGK